MNKHKAYIPEMTLTDNMYQEKREEKDLPALKTALTHRFNGLKENMNEDWLHTSETILTARWTTERQELENKNGKENNSTGVLNDK